ncbi:alpha/beta hydrolase family protein [Desulfuromonas soudanensis]|uniref:Alpha/beta hydrolase family protein n=1 Tax=Desulfuromonas soudanensis TaxID=1603606 RepID=A0A0M5ITB2_9BACT|nr:alpha/beta hydrolase [Desulfuromonas soudanensis]ALC15256.1 alpha/beta hydrolase family protein [Desulfuromonas soudanensis]
MIHALPGMGADRRMYPEPWPSIQDFVAHDWVRYSGERSLSGIARSMCDFCRINDGDTLIGASLGGMVACEITKIRKISRLYLIGSAVRKEEISRLLAVLHPLAQLAPVDWLRISAGKIPVELAQMFSSAEAPFLRAMCAAIFKWEGLGQSRTTVVRLHGRQDFVIPPPEAVDLLIDGGHLISMTHAAECTEFVKANYRLQGNVQA